MDERPYPIILSVPTSAGGATPAATFSFFSVDYEPPRQPRSKTSDLVHNQNGKFKFDYDNGPGPYVWKPFQIHISDDFYPGYLPPATQQWANLDFLWKYTEGPMKLEAPDGLYTVSWAEGMDLERQFLTRKGAAGDKARVESRIAVQFEES